MLKGLLIFILGMLFSSVCLAQITPPGLGEVNTAQWFAIGLKQKLNKNETITSVTSIGLGTTSSPDNYNSLDRKAIYVVNQEFTNQFKKHWKYSGAFSYRWQNIYQKEKPYTLDFPKAKQEIRVYSRFSYLNKFKKIDYSLTYRPELRFFYNPDFTSATEKLQFRSRISTKIAFNLNSLATQKIITNAEFIFSTSKTLEWNKWKYKERRLSVYYSLRIPKQKVTCNIGYMNSALKKAKIRQTHYFAMDITFNDIF